MDVVVANVSKGNNPRPSTLAQSTAASSFNILGTGATDASSAEGVAVVAIGSAGSGPSTHAVARATKVEEVAGGSLSQERPTVSGHGVSHAAPSAHSRATDAASTSMGSGVSGHGVSHAAPSTHSRATGAASTSAASAPMHLGSRSVVKEGAAAMAARGLDRSSASAAGISGPILRLLELNSLPVQEYIQRCIADESVRATLAEYVPGDDEIGNTFCTNVLQSFAFSWEDKIDIDALNYLLIVLTEDARAGKEYAIRALKTPNKLPEAARVCSKGGFPQNTPLQLLVKMDNIAGVKTILPVLEGRDLLAVTPRGNSTLHIAVLTGRFAISLLLLKRARDLGVLEQMLSHANSAGYTPDHMREALFKKLDNSMEEAYFVLKKLFGGEEIAKARLGFDRKHFFYYRLFAERWLTEHLGEPAEFKTISLADLLELSTEEV